MDSLKILLVDDNTLIRSSFKNLLININSLNTVKECDKESEVIPFLKLNEIDVIFMDVAMKVADNIEGYKFVIAGAPNFDKSFYESFFNEKKYEIEFDNTYSILSRAESAMVTSGTAALETALFNVPQVVCYKGSAISVFIAKRLVKIDYMSLVNLILDKPAVVELLQEDVNINRLSIELRKTLLGGESRNNILIDYKVLGEKVGKAGASLRAAEDIYNRELKKEN